MRQVCRCEKQPLCWSVSAFHGRIKRSGSGSIGSPTTCLTRRRRSRRRVAVDETAVQVDTEWYWLYAAIDLESKLLLDVRLSQRRGTTPAAAFLRQLKQQHNLSDAYFLVDGFGYLTA